MIGEVELEQVEPLVDGFREAELADQQVDGADAAAGDGFGLGRGLVLDVARREDRLGRGGSDRPIEPAADFALAGGMVAMWNRFHSKSPWGLGNGIGVGRSNVPQTPGDFEFQPTAHRFFTWDHAWLRTIIISLEPPPTPAHRESIIESGASSRAPGTSG